MVMFIFFQYSSEYNVLICEIVKDIFMKLGINEGQCLFIEVEDYFLIINLIFVVIIGVGLNW